MHQHNVKDNIRNHAGKVSFVAYIGSSMNPTLREPAIMEIVPYNGRPVRVGNVVHCLPPGTEEAIVHRVVRVTPAGMVTRGDDNPRDDGMPLQPQHIYGRVVAAHCGRKRRRIAGGAMGRMLASFFVGGAPSTLACRGSSTRCIVRWRAGGESPVYCPRRAGRTSPSFMRRGTPSTGCCWGKR